MTGGSAFARAIADIVAWFAFLISATALAARFVPVVNHAVLVVSALVPYLTVISAGVATGLLAVNGRWWAVGLTFVLLAASVAVQVPRFLDSGRAGGHSVAVRVFTLNLREGQADSTFLASVARSRADLLILEELTPESLETLDVLNSDFPYRALDVSSYARGVGVWSRYPLTAPNQISGYPLGMLSVSTRVPGAASDTLVLAAHLVGPWPQPIDDWRKEIAALPSTLRWVADLAGDGAVIVAGDFNATTDMQPFRRLLDHGYRDAATQSGAGLTRTYPSNAAVPPLIGIDHILIRNSSASDVHTVPVPGTDHLGLAATVHLPGVDPQG